ncbi:DUF2125 domain-containing protein [Mangrovicoccus sp. HB161399]|uniref:DUF2125 domain-containing protein n=1 Tax=Mangrovicoccus sp. HB161399 TaxID=2720392 RepID=UPI001558181F|nr:DUF2125 domain-containing protein [Mangrovicoccus sp. HB161399]
MTKILPAAALLLCAAAPLRADVTPGQVWQQWQDAGAIYGLGLSAREETPVSGGLRLGGVTAALDLGAIGRIELTLPEVVMEQRDGGVEIAFPAPLGFAFAQAPAAGGGLPELALSGEIVPGDGSMRAEGDPGEIRYSYGYPNVTWHGRSETGPGGAAETGVLTGALSDLSGSWNAPGGPRTGSGTGQMTASGAVQEMEIRGPDGSIASRQSTRWQGLSARAALQAADGKFAELAAASHAAATRQVSTSGTPGMPGIAATLETRDLEGTLQAGAGAADIGSSSAGTAVTIEGLPFGSAPLAFTGGRSRMQMHLPYELADGSRDAELSLDLEDLAADTQVWNLFDPDGHVSRMPGRLKLDLGGSVAALAPGAMPQAPGLPFQVDGVQIRDLLLAFGGAVLKGSGDFRIEPGPYGQPEPVGKLSLSLENGMALLDGLIAAGAIPKQQLFGLRMMLGMVAKQDGSGDRLVSEIEAKPGRNLVLNGMSLPLP